LESTLTNNISSTMNKAHELFDEEKIEVVVWKA